MNKKLILTVVGLVLAGFLIAIIKFNSGGRSVAINNFEDCVAAGYPVMESFPEKCSTPDGKTFTKETAQPISPQGDEEANIVQKIKEYISIMGYKGDSSILKVEAVSWSNSCLGAASKEEICAMVITPGYRVTAKIGGSIYIFNTNKLGTSIREAHQ